MRDYKEYTVCSISEVNDASLQLVYVFYFLRTFGLSLKSMYSLYHAVKAITLKTVSDA